MIPPVLISFFLSYWKEAILAVLIIGALGYAYYTVDQNGYNRAKAECEIKMAQGKQVLKDAVEAEIAKREKAAKEYEDQIAKTKGKVSVVTKIVTKEIEKPVYKDCKVPPSGSVAIKEVVKELNSVREQAKEDPSVLKKFKEKLEADWKSK